MNKVLIIPVMRGQTKEDIDSAVEIVSKELDRFGAERIETFATESVPDDVNRSLWCLAKSLEVMAKADTVIFVGDYTKARGCLIEHDVAVAYGLDVMWK